MKKLLVFLAAAIAICTPGAALADLPFTTGGAANWTVETDGSWRTGAISDSQTTWAEVAVTGPCIVTFQWKISSELYDRLHCYLDGVETVSSISGENTDWAMVSLTVESAGSHKVKFDYIKDYSTSKGSDCGWVKDFTVHESHVLTLNANGGTVKTSEQLAGDGLAAGRLPEPVWSGGEYVFTGWFTAASGGTRVTKDTIITSDMALYAHWVEAPFSETGGAAPWLIDADGNWRSGAVSYWERSWSEVTVTAPCVVTFKWKTSSSNYNHHKLSCYLDGSEIDESPISGTMSDWKTVTLAVSGSGSRVVKFEYYKSNGTPEGEDCGWVKDFTVHESHVLTFNANGGTVKTSEQLAGDGLAAGRLPEPVWSGGEYVFTGWFTAASGGDRVTKDTIITSDMTLYAHWTESPFSATGGTAPWMIEVDGSWRSGTIGPSSASWADVAVTGPCVVSFKWKTSYTSNNGDLTCRLDDVEIVGSPIAGNMSDWNTVTFTIAESGSHVIEFWYYVYASFLTAPGEDYGRVKDFEVSAAETRTLAFIANGGTVATDEKRVVVGYPAGALPVPVWNGAGTYRFTGWFTAASGGTEFTSGTTVSADMTLYAHWTESPFTTGGDAAWTIDGDGSWKAGAITNGQATWAEVAVTGPCVVSFQWKNIANNNDILHCYLDGTYKDSIRGDASTDWGTVSFVVDESGSHTVKFNYTKAKFENGIGDAWVKDFAVTPLVYYTLTFNANGGTVAPATKRIVGGYAVGELPVSVWSGEGNYDFLGWFTAASGGTEVTAETVVTGDMTLYAHWVEMPFATGGNAAWTIDGDGYWKSGTISDRQTTWAEVAVTVPCVVSFQWKTSSEENYDKLHCYLVGNGETNEVVSAISGAMSDWSAVSFVVDGSGSRAVRFEYAKDSSNSRGNDCGWVKDFEASEARTLVFNANGGMVATGNKYVAYGHAAGELPVPVWSGEGTMYFLGWFTAVSGGNRVAEATVITADMTLYAHWSTEYAVDLADLVGNVTVSNNATVFGTLAGDYKVSIADGATVTISNVVINGLDDSNYPWAGITCLGDATIVLVGENTITGFCEECPGIYIPVAKTLTIKGDGSLDVSSNGKGAGIGGGSNSYCGNIVIEGGVITATGSGNAAGIGGGYKRSCGNITISGGVVTASEGATAAGIGSGRNGSCGDITIVGGIVTATGGVNAAGIGSGCYGSCGAITIAQSIKRVVATRGLSAKNPIGAGTSASCGSITVSEGLNDEAVGDTRTITPKLVNLAELTDDIRIADGAIAFGTLADAYKVSIADGATVTISNATIIGVNDDGKDWAGITCEGNATIILEDANTVKGFYEDYPGIYVPAGKTLTIRGGGSLAASSNGDGAGIGGGYEIDCGDIVIAGGSITATGGEEAAGIGGGANARCGAITIGGATVTAMGGDGAAGVGGGHYGLCGVITINGDGITATGGESGAGIGCGSGDGSTCGGVVINGGTVVATGGDYAAGIGSGNSSACGVVSIGPDIVSVVATCGAGCDNPIGAGAYGACDGFTMAGSLNAATSGSTCTVTAKVIDLALLAGDITITDGRTVTGTLAGRYKVSIADGATVTLSNATISLSQASGSTWAGLTCEGSATIVLAGENAVKSLNEYCPGIFVPQYETLTIQGDGSLSATGGQIYGAGIGAGYGSSRSCGSIVIESGEIAATSGGFAAGIGCGFGSNCDDITISGGTVTATGGAGCAGIGGSTDYTCGNITISGGTVVATGGEKAAGIGTGSAYEGMGECGYITISGGTVTATGGANAAGIGTGEDGYCYGITIGEGITRITATCGDGDAEPIGIGGGEYSECESNISGSLSDVTTGSTRVLEAKGESSAFAAWAAGNGLAGADAAWDAKPAKWNGWANAFIYTYGEGLADGAQGSDPIGGVRVVE